jgi:hypothetical protein
MVHVAIRKAQAPPSQSDQSALYGELAQECSARSPNRGANSELTTTGPTAGEKKIADIGAGNQQDKTYG